MDVKQMIADLEEERARINRVIANLEALQNQEPGLEAVPPKPRRGRKFMGPKEREQVSTRMKKYWADRKKGGNQSPGAASSDPQAGQPPTIQ